MKAEIIQSGSDGNCIILNDIIALDCGVAYKKVAPYVQRLQLVFISHSHQDHIKESTVKALARERPALRFCVGDYLAHKLTKSGVVPSNIDLICPYMRYEYCGFQIEPFPLHHDVPNYGLKIFMGGEKAIYIVDSGYIDDIEAKNFDLYLLEANHQEAEIAARIAEKQAAGEFAYEYRAAANHLSQEQALDWLAKNAGPNSKYIFLHQHK